MAWNGNAAEASFGGQSNVPEGDDWRVVEKYPWLKIKDGGLEQPKNPAPEGDDWRETKYEGFQVKDGGLERPKNPEVERDPEAEQALGETAIAIVNQESAAPEVLGASAMPGAVSVEAGSGTLAGTEQRAAAGPTGTESATSVNAVTEDGTRLEADVIDTPRYEASDVNLGNVETGGDGLQYNKYGSLGVAEADDAATPKTSVNVTMEDGTQLTWQDGRWVETDAAEVKNAPAEAESAPEKQETPVDVVMENGVRLTWQDGKWVETAEVAEAEDASVEVEANPENQELAIEMQEKTDKFGNPLYTKETIERAIQARIDRDPQLQEAIEAQAQARVDASQRERSEIEKAMAGRSEQEFLQNQSTFIKDLVDEQGKIEQQYRYEQNPQMKSYLERQLKEIERTTTEARAMFERTSRYFAEVKAQGGEASSEPGIGKHAADGTFEDLGLQPGVKPPEASGIGSAEPVVAPQSENLTPEADTSDDELEKLWASVPGEPYQPPDAQEIEDLYRRKALAKHESSAANAAELNNPAERENKVLRVFEKLKQKAATAIRRTKRKVLLGMAMVLSAGTLVSCSPNMEAATVSANQPKTEMDAVTGADQKAERITMTEADAMASPDYVSPAEFSAEDTRQVAANGVRYDYTAEYLSSEKLGINNFGRDYTVDYGDREAMVNSVYQICYDQWEVLAAHAANFPSVLKACGIEIEPTLEGGHIDPRILDDMVSNSENGGELQAKILQAYKDMVLNNKDTKFQFYQEYKDETAYYMLDMRNAGEEANPTNMGLGSVRMQRNGVYEVRVAVKLADGTIEYADYKLDCGYQTCYEDTVEFTPTDQNTETPGVVTTPEGVPVVNPGTPEKEPTQKEKISEVELPPIVGVKPSEDEEEEKKDEEQQEEEEKKNEEQQEEEDQTGPQDGENEDDKPDEDPDPDDPDPGPGPQETLTPKDPNKVTENMTGPQDAGNITQTEQNGEVTDGTLENQQQTVTDGAISGGTEADNAQNEANQSEIQTPINTEQERNDAADNFDRNNNLNTGAGTGTGGTGGTVSGNG